MKKMQKDMDRKLSEIEQLQISRRDKDESSESLERLRSSILNLENENSNLKVGAYIHNEVNLFLRIIFFAINIFLLRSSLM